MGKRVLMMMTLACATWCTCMAQGDERKAFIRKYRTIAIEEMERTGIPASITLAQGILESASGTSRLAREANNFFGIKANDWTGETYVMDDDRRGELFRKYRYPEESWVDHSEFLMTRERYASLFKLKPTDYKGWAKGLKKAGYATAPDYAQQLIRIIEEEELYRYDDAGRRYSRLVGEVTSSQRDYGRNSYTERIVYVNGVACIRTRGGDSFEAIATACGMPLERLLRYNDKRETTIRGGMHVFLGKKKGKAARGYRYHRVKAGETMYEIAQEYGIRLGRLLRYNYMEVDDVPQAGELIGLRKASKLY